MFIRRLVQTVISSALLLFVWVSVQGAVRPQRGKPVPAEVPVQVTLCELQKNPAAYDHKLVEVTGFVSHGFEDFTIFNPDCDSDAGIWLDYGGRMSSGTIFCCGVANRRRRSRPLVVEKIPTTLMADERFARFDKRIQSESSTIMRATLRGRFFAREIVSDKDGNQGVNGFGHFGSFNLLIIQQVVEVDSAMRPDLDYAAETDQPEIDRVGCGYRSLIDGKKEWLWLNLLRNVEAGQRDWAYSDPQRVAADTLARLLETDEGSFQNLEVKRTAQGKVVYQWKPSESEKRYMVVVSRPFLLSYYAKDPNRIPWIPIGVFEIFCN